MALTACAPVQGNPFIGSRVWVVAHQGGEGLWPSNTMYAFDRAVKLGADMLDLDVHASRDGQLVVIHDDRVDRTTNGQGRVSDLTLEALRSLDAGWYWPQRSKETDPHPFRGQGIRIPTLEEVLAAHASMPMTIEIKQDTPSIAEPFCAALRRHGMTGKAIVASFSDRAMRDFRAACPEVMTSMTEAEVRNLLFLGDLSPRPAQARALQVPVRAAGLEVVTPEFVRFAAARNLVVQPWTINEPEEMRRLVAMGVHGINTDRPDLLLNVLGRATPGATP